jgi:endonuclease/exonuclease/phosphatase (EEP) superfamily protein YafD
VSAFTVMTYNVQHDNADMAATIAAIANANADVVMLQEVSRRWQTAVTSALGDVYPHRAFHLHTRPAGGLATLSRYPIGAREVYPSPVGWFPAERSVLATPSGEIQIANLHLRPAIDQGSWIRGFTTTPPLRLTEIQTYWPKLDPALPMIVAGDFNEAPFSGDVIKFLEGHGLSRAATSGPPTWHYGDLISFDLDHVMTRDLVASDGRVLDAGTSDHRPVVVTIAASAQ